MKVSVHRDPTADRRAHRLPDRAVRIALDWVFADAEGHDVGHLLVTVGDETTQRAVEARLPLSGNTPGQGGTAVAWFSPRPSPPVAADHLYVITAGVNAWRRRYGATAARGLASRTLYVYPWKTRIYGAAMRAFGCLGRPDWQDRAIQAVRRTYVSDRPALSSYVVWAWTTDTDVL